MEFFVYFFISLSTASKHCVNFLMKHGTFIMHPAHKWSPDKYVTWCLNYKTNRHKRKKKFSTASLHVERERLRWNVYEHHQNYVEDVLEFNEIKVMLKKQISGCRPCFAFQFFPQPGIFSPIHCTFCLLLSVAAMPCPALSSNLFSKKPKELWKFDIFHSFVFACFKVRLR